MKSFCRLCGTENTEELIIAQRIYKCRFCGCLYRSEDIDYSFYVNSNYWYKGDEELKLYQKSLFVWFEKYILQGNSVEFGAADGDFISLVREVLLPEYKTVYNELVDMIRLEYRNKNIETIIGQLENFPESKKYKNIFLVNVIEHLNNPINSTRKLLNILDSTGRIFIATDDGDSINAHNEILYYREHMCIFGRKGIKYLCKENKLKILKYFTMPLGLIFLVLEKENK